MKSRVLITTIAFLLILADTNSISSAIGSIFRPMFKPEFKFEFKPPEDQIGGLETEFKDKLLPIEEEIAFMEKEAKENELLNDMVDDVDDMIDDRDESENNINKILNALSDSFSILDTINNDESSSTDIIPNIEVKTLSESLFKMDTNNAYKYITVNLQGKTKENSTVDDAPLLLLDVKPEAYKIPTIKSVLELYDNYELDFKTKETVTSEESKEESELLDKFLETDVFKAAVKFLISNKFIPHDEYEIKNLLKRIWFTQFELVKGIPFSSGFEAIFIAEKFNSHIVGPRNWIYFAKQEAQRNLDYRGYIKNIKLGNKAEMIKIRFAFNIPGTEQSVTTLLVGLSPELEMALYTVCFYVYPNNICPISLDGKDVKLITTKFKYPEKDILIAGFVAE